MNADERGWVERCWFLTGPTASGKTPRGGGACAAARGRDRLDGLDGPVPGDGHRHGETHRRRASGDTAPPDRRSVALRGVQPCPVHRGGRAVRRGNPRPGSRGALRGRYAPLSEGALLRGIFQGPPADAALREQLRRQAEQRAAELAPPAARPGRPRRRRAAAPERHAAADSGAGGVREDGRADQRTCSGSSTWAGVPTSAAFSCSIGPGRSFTAGSTAGVDAMFAAGLVDEVRGLLASDRPLSKTAAQAVGYREVIEHLAGRPGPRRHGRAGQNPHAAIRQASGHLVPEPERVPDGGGARTAGRGGRCRAYPRHGKAPKVTELHH